jgi:hypothetical protein
MNKSKFIKMMMIIIIIIIKHKESNHIKKVYSNNCTLCQMPCRIQSKFKNMFRYSQLDPWHETGKEQSH